MNVSDLGGDITRSTGYTAEFERWGILVPKPLKQLFCAQKF